MTPQTITILIQKGLHKKPIEKPAIESALEKAFQAFKAPKRLYVPEKGLTSNDKELKANDS